MKTLNFKDYKSLNENLNQEFLEPTKENIESFWLDYSKVDLNQDGSIDYYGDVWLEYRGLVEIPFNFRTVHGNFYCTGNHIRSLKSLPKTVEKKIYCRDNEIIFLDDYGRNYQISALQNPIVSTTIPDFDINIIWWDDNILNKFKKALPYIWDDVKTEENFLNILEKMIDHDLILEYPEEILRFSNEFNIDLMKHLPRNILKVLKSKGDTIDDIGFGF